MVIKTTYDDLEYHLRQYDKVYRSTEVMVNWLEQYGGYLGTDEPQSICDMACGCGANLAYLASKFPQNNYLGIELEERLVLEGNKRLKCSNAKILQGDWFQLDKSLKGKFDGIISFQTLSWLGGGV